MAAEKQTDNDCQGHTHTCTCTCVSACVRVYLGGLWMWMMMLQARQMGTSLAGNNSGMWYVVPVVCKATLPYVPVYTCMLQT